MLINCDDLTEKQKELLNKVKDYKQQLSNIQFVFTKDEIIEAESLGFVKSKISTYATKDSDPSYSYNSSWDVC